jgi:hypothetical protein
MSSRNGRLLTDEGAQRFMPYFIAANSQAAQRVMAQYHADIGYSQVRSCSENLAEPWIIMADVSEGESGPFLTFSMPDAEGTFSVRPNQGDSYLALESFALLPQRRGNGALIGMDWADLVANNGSGPWRFKHIQANDAQALKEDFAAFITGSGVRFAVMLLLLPREDALDNMIVITSPLPEDTQVVFQLRILEEINAASSLPQICLFWR